MITQTEQPNLLHAVRPEQRLSRRGAMRLGLASALALAGVRAANGVSFAQPSEQEPIALGAYLPLVLDDPAVLLNFTAAIGRTIDYTIWYEGWASGPFGEQQRTYLARIRELGLTPVIAWDPMDQNGPPINQPMYKLSNIIRGDFDAYIDSWADGIAAYGDPVFLNFAHEMNGNWYPWGIGVNGNQPGEFVQAWRHVHDRFTARQANNVVWVWTPNEEYEGVPSPVADVFPGADYVDWFGMNGFNWGAAIRWRSCDCQSAWRTFNQIFEKTYASLTALADKPIMIGETASAEAGGSKADWITDALTVQIPTIYPKVRAFSWFNKIATGLDTVAPGVVEATTEVDWRVTSSPSAQKAFADAVQLPYYQGTLRSSAG